jgi:hypothetical protein
MADPPPRPSDGADGEQLVSEIRGMPDSSPLPLVLESVHRVLAGLDPLMISIGLAIAASTPSLAGEAGALAAISYDLAHKKWFWAGLSAISMLPVVGYIPAFLKVGLLVFILNRRLKALEAIAPEIHHAPEVLQIVRSALEKYYRQLPNIRLVRPIRRQLERIMDLDEYGQIRGVAARS